MAMPMRLHADPRSSSSLRVLCYLRHKGISLEIVPVSLQAGAQRASAFLALNPSGAVPVLELDDGRTLAQTQAILEWLEEQHPQPPMLPTDPWQRAQVRSLCALVACDIHPVTNMKVRQAVAARAGDEATQRWVGEWTHAGLDAMEGWLARHAGRYSVGDSLTLADFFVAPLAFNARRFGVALEGRPVLQRVFAACLALPAFEPLR